ncbi:MAG: metallophosphoesterase [Acidimicrobiaceae bacterium]|nr:metallophosphoesterase [Acidimicrobiaceae bacterium]
MLLNYYTIGAAIITGAVAGAVVVSLIRQGFRSIQIAAVAVAIGFGGTFLFNIGALFITGPDVFTSIHVTYLVLTVGVPLAGTIVLFFARNRTRTITALCVLALVPVPLGIYATYIEPFWLRVDRVELEVKGVSEDIRIGVLADLQTTAIGPYENSAVDRLIEVEPDLVLIPGDLYQIDQDRFDEKIPEFNEMIQRLVDEVPIVLLVSGNTDRIGGLGKIVRGTGARVLNNQIETLEVNGNTVSVLGITLFGNERVAQLRAEEIAGSSVDLRIVLAHQPDEIRLIESTPVDLLVAGHTHGGQIALPFIGPVVTASDVPRHVAAGGLHELHGTPVYVSTGVGRERRTAPQVRFGVRPSIGIIDITGA